MTVYLCFFALWLFSCAIIVEGGPKKAKKKSGAELRVTKEYCSSDDECESKQCCQISERKDHKMCYESCDKLRALKAITEQHCASKVFRNQNITYCLTPTMSWYKAFRDCCLAGGQLPLVNDHDTLKVLTEMVINLKVVGQIGWMWTGLTKMSTSNTSPEPWTWYQPNSPKWDKSFWEIGAPNGEKNKRSESCTTIGSFPPGNNRYGLTDDPCYEPWGYACVTPLKSP